MGGLQALQPEGFKDKRHCGTGTQPHIAQLLFKTLLGMTSYPGPNPHICIPLLLTAPPGD